MPPFHLALAGPIGRGAALAQADEQNAILPALDAVRENAMPHCLHVAVNIRGCRFGLAAAAHRLEQEAVTPRRCARGRLNVWPQI